ncbi:MAG: DNA mismatch repair protein MutS [Polaribacter sp.]|nr:DNA mismatch repair protein MutS [Polaribacter sp.]
MEKLVHFYTDENLKLEKELHKIKIKLTNLSVLRLLVFFFTLFGIYFSLGNPTIVSIIMIVGVGIFSFLLSQYLKIKEKKKLVLCKISINKTEIRVLEGDFSFLPEGKEFLDSNHFFSHDIDLFGRHSFFQYINRTSTEIGTAELAKIISKNNILSIDKKQEVIKELSKKVKWRQHFTALASLVKTEYSSKVIVRYIQDYKAVFSKLVLPLPILFSIVSSLLIGLVSFQMISYTLLLLWFIIGLVVTAIFFKRTEAIYANAGKSKTIFKQYHLLLQEIENGNFSSEILQEKQEIIQSENLKASAIFMKFSKILDAFDQRNNVLIFILGNAFFLRDLRNAVKVETWIHIYNHTVKKWFEVIAFFDAGNSLANFCFNHSDYTFPELVKENSIIQAIQLGHPLLKSEKRIDNNFTISDNQFFIVTGANMAGKSTFLRTVSLSIVMANCGLPVCAESFKYAPRRLITSMRTTDSLSEDESYFYSELKRLKFIVDTIEVKDYFIILDEILKGTNSKDKAIGSKKFIEKLIKSKSTGIIATHDVSLCDLENEFSDIKNYYFDAEITESELHFDYTLKNGICKNMNASFLLEKMKII